MQYDGTGKLREAIAGLYGLSPGSVAQIAAHIKKAKAALNITSKSKNLPDNDKLAIYRWHVERLNPAQGAELSTLNGTGAADGLSPPEQPPEIEIEIATTVVIEPTVTAIDAQPIPHITKPQHSGNWGGVRQGSGRKATGKQTVTMRVPVELAGIIKQLKGIGGTQGQAALLEVVSGFEIALQNSRHMPKA